MYGVCVCVCVCKENVRCERREYAAESVRVCVVGKAQRVS